MSQIRQLFMNDIVMTCPEITKDAAEDLERGVFNWCIDQCAGYKTTRNWKNPRFVHLYKDKARSVLNNLDKTSYVGNDRLFDRLMKKEFAPHEVSFMKPENMYPEQWATLLDNKMKKEILPMILRMTIPLPTMILTLWKQTNKKANNQQAKQQKML